MSNLSFISSYFKRYYSSVKISLDNVSSREFGIGDLNNKIVKRHLSFSSNDELNLFLSKNNPFYISYSAALYEHPSFTPMEKKNWLGADLIFDIDSELSKKGIEIAKQEANKAIDILKNDFGIKDFYIYYSGNRGFHIHIRENKVRSLEGDERRELVDYLLCIGIEPFDISKKGKTRIIKAKPIKNGQSARIIGYIRANNKEFIRSNNFSLVPMFMQKLKKAINLFSVNIDPVVSYDTSKLIRMPYSLHGSTGLKVMRIKDIDSFSPEDAAVFKEKHVKIDVLSNTTLPFQSYKRLEKGEHNVPEFLALFMLLKKKAKLI